MIPLDCRSDEGVFVGLVDGIIAQARVVARAVRCAAPGDDLRHALADLAADEDIALLLTVRG